MHYDMRGRQPGEDDDFVLDRLFGSFQGKKRGTGYHSTYKSQSNLLRIYIQQGASETAQ